MRKHRKADAPKEKVGTICRHLLDGVTVSDLCDEHGLHSTVYERWQQEFFEGGAAAFAKESSWQITQLNRRLADAEEQLGRKNEVRAEVMEEYLRCKKDGGAAEAALGCARESWLTSQFRQGADWGATGGVTSVPPGRAGSP